MQRRAASTVRRGAFGNLPPKGGKALGAYPTPLPENVPDLPAPDPVFLWSRSGSQKK